MRYTRIEDRSAIVPAQHPRPNIGLTAGLTAPGPSQERPPSTNHSFGRFWKWMWLDCGLVEHE
jgi:hypothetical protein